MKITQDDLHRLYESVLKAFLVANNVDEVICTDSKEHFFDKLHMDDNGNLHVEKYDGIHFNALLFDFSWDYARCMEHLECDLWRLQHGDNTKYFVFTFKD